MTEELDIEQAERFSFGDNWARFLEQIDERRIVEAEESLRLFLGVQTLEGVRFLDIGSGSGLFSLAARRLGANVVSFDFDEQSVACTKELRRRFFPDDNAWQIERGSVLDSGYVEAFGQFDVVYSWGVLHHTGAMWLAIENALGRVGPKGKLYIALYNDQGWKSHVWWLVKASYNALPKLLKPVLEYSVAAVWHTALIAKYTLRLEPMTAIRPLLSKDRERGMSRKYDRRDWIGGFPFEFVGYATLVNYLERRSFQLIHGRENTTLGCHEVSLQKQDEAASS